jgi:hypothetical protein
MNPRRVGRPPRASSSQQGHRRRTHEFWPDDAGYADVPIQGIISHRQVTDAYLALLARARGARVATFDQAMAKLHNDVADLIPDS